MKTIHNTSYQELLNSGHCVPKNSDYNYFQTGWEVGGLYAVISKENKKPIKVKVTQSHPFHLKTA